MTRFRKWRTHDARCFEERPLPASKEGPAPPYVTLATLVRYEHVQTSLDNPQLAAAMELLAADDYKREHLDFTLKDLSGKTWTLSQLRGKVVLVIFGRLGVRPAQRRCPISRPSDERFNSKGLVGWDLRR